MSLIKNASVYYQAIVSVLKGVFDVQTTEHCEKMKPRISEVNCFIFQKMTRNSNGSLIPDFLSKMTSDYNYLMDDLRDPRFCMSALLTKY